MTKTDSFGLVGENLKLPADGWAKGNPGQWSDIDLMVAHFDDRSLLEPENLKRVKVLGYSFRGVTVAAAGH